MQIRRLVPSSALAALIVFVSPVEAQYSDSKRDMTSRSSCISLERDSNSLSIFAKNGCGERLNVGLYYTSTGTTGMEIVAPYGSQSSPQHKGDIEYYACVYPAYPRHFGGNRWRCE